MTGTIEVVSVYQYRPLVDDIRIYIGRPGSWYRATRMVNRLCNRSVLGNDHPLSDINNDRLRKESIELYKVDFDKRIKLRGNFRRAIGQIYKAYKRGKSIKLVCFCAPRACHGDIIKSFIESV